MSLVAALLARLAVASFLVAASGAVAWLLVQTVLLARPRDPRSLFAGVRLVAWHTQFGRLTLGHLAMLGVAGACLAPRLARTRGCPVAAPIAAAGAVALLAGEPPGRRAPTGAATTSLDAAPRPAAAGLDLGARLRPRDLRARCGPRSRGAGRSGPEGSIKRSMAFAIRPVEYFYTTVPAGPGEGHSLLSRLAELGINLLAFTAVPTGPTRAQLTLFPDDSSMLQDEARKAGIVLDGPHPALLVQGDDRLGALAEIHGKLADARVDVFASSGVADGRGGYGYVIYVRPADFDRATAALEV